MNGSGLQAIKAGKFIDGTGAEPQNNIFILVEGKKIKAIGQDIDIPEGIALIDASNKTVMPGLIDSHLHLSGSLGDLNAVPTRPKELALIKSIRDAELMLSAGYTTLKCCGGRNAVLLKQSVTEGTLSGIPRLIAAGYYLAQTGGHGDSAYLPTECVDVRTSHHNGNIVNFGAALLCDGVDECIKATRYALRSGSDFIKILASTTHTDEIKAVVDTAAMAGKSVTVHCTHSQIAANAIPAGAKTLEHAIEMRDDLIASARDHGVIFVSTAAVFWAELLNTRNNKQGNTGGMNWEWIWQSTCDSYRRIHNAGAMLAAGSDYFNPDHPLGTNARELEILVKYCDFSPMEAILAATRNGAMACFISQITGTLEPGKMADLIIVDGDPLADIKVLQEHDRIKIVMLEGKIEINRGI